MIVEIVSYRSTVGPGHLVLAQSALGFGLGRRDNLLVIDCAHASDAYSFERDARHGFTGINLAFYFCRSQVISQLAVPAIGNATPLLIRPNHPGIVPPISNVSKLEPSAVVRPCSNACSDSTAFAALWLLLLVGLRGVIDALLVRAPLVLAALWAVASAVALGLPFNFANIIVLPLLLSLGVASGIHLVMRARSEAAGAKLTDTSTPRAVVFSALTTIGSFGTLALSAHRGTASMGALLTIAIFFTLLCTLIVLPALMAMVGRHRQNQG